MLPVGGDLGQVDHDGQCGLGSCSTPCSELMCQACLVPRVCIIRAHAQTITVSSYFTFLAPQTIKQSRFWPILWLMPVVLICRSLLTGSCSSSECPVWCGEPAGLLPSQLRTCGQAAGTGVQAVAIDSPVEGDGNGEQMYTLETLLRASPCCSQFWGKSQSPLPKRCFINGSSLAS